jgi:PAS domain S-box-containing protein
MLLENTDDVVHVLSLKGLFLYLSPSCKKVLEYEAADLVGNSLSTVCHPSDIVPVTRELKDTTTGNPVNIVFRIRRKNSGYTWFESHGSLFVEQGKGRKCIILVGRKRPVFALSRRNLEANGGIGDSELWTKLSTSGLFLYVSSNIRSLLDLQPDSLVGTSIQDLMRKESRPEFGRATEKARRGKIVTCKHEVQNRRGQVLQAQTTLYPGDASEGQKPSFLLAQTKLLKASSRNLAPASISGSRSIAATPRSHNGSENHATGHISQPAGGALAPGTQDAALASEDNIFDELRTTKCSSWQFELRQMEKVNRILAEELGGLLSSKKKRKRRKGVGNVVRDCANCHTRNTPEWRRGPSGQRDLCNSCGLRWAKQVSLSNLLTLEILIDILIRLVGFLHAIPHVGPTRQTVIPEARSPILLHRHCIKNCLPIAPSHRPPTARVASTRPSSRNKRLRMGLLLLAVLLQQQGLNLQLDYRH